MHSYTTPAILVIPVEQVDPDYHAWIVAEKAGREHVNELRLTTLAITAAILAAAPQARAQSFPDHPVKVVSAWAAGGPSDTMARLATRGLDR